MPMGIPKLGRAPPRRCAICGRHLCSNQSREEGVCGLCRTPSLSVHKVLPPDMGLHRAFPCGTRSTGRKGRVGQGRRTDLHR